MVTVPEVPAATTIGAVRVVPEAGRAVIITERSPEPELASPIVRVPVPAPPRFAKASAPWLRTVPPV